MKNFKSTNVKFHARVFVLALSCVCMTTLFSCSDLADEFDPSNNTEWPVDPSSVKILIDASHGGGGWWFPQSGVFDPDKYHQGMHLANYLRRQGFTVDELGRGVTINDVVLEGYQVVIRASGFTDYTPFELEAYQKAIENGIALVLISDHKTHDHNGDKLSEMLGLKFEGSVIGHRSASGAPLIDVTRFKEHPITEGIDVIKDVPAASALMNADENPNVEVLGWFSEDSFVDLDYDGVKSEDEPSGMPYIGVLNHPTSKIFFVTDINKIEIVPFTLVDNLTNWIKDCLGEL